MGQCHPKKVIKKQVLGMLVVMMPEINNIQRNNVEEGIYCKQHVLVAFIVKLRAKNQL